ncbi:zeta-crystallin-like isoform X2 [Ptychodera flava]|uniref:zeta-crystallin-like isoform X2 n=1 Tax=Ptychodera flava TaxID=63121 RepID=UPI00396A0B84
MKAVYVTSFEQPSCRLEVRDNVPKPEVGPDTPQDRVYAHSKKMGHFAEYVSLREVEVRHLPTEISFEQGAVLAIPYLTAYRAIVNRGKAKKGETILIHGASGPVGLACCQIARSLDLRVLGTASTAEGQQLVKENGADLVFNHKSPDHITQILDASDGKGVDLIVETNSSLNLQGDIKMSAKGGRILVIGNGPGQLQGSLAGLMPKEINIVGVGLVSATQDNHNEAYTFIESGVKAGSLVPVVGRQYDLDDTTEAIENLGKPKTTLGKPIIAMS